MKGQLLIEEVRVLNQIITYGNILPVIPFGDRFIEFILEAFNSIKNVNSSIVCIKNQQSSIGDLIDEKCEKCLFFNDPDLYSCLLTEKANLNVISIGTFINNYGTIAFKTDEAFSINLLSALHNFANNVTVHIENHLQNEKLKENNRELELHRDNLEDLVREKTFTLKNQNTEYSLLNKQYKKQTKKLLKAQELGKIGHWELNINSGHLIWSDQSYKIFNLTPDEFKPTYKKILKLIHPEDKNRVKKIFTTSLKNKEPYKFDHRLKLENGTIRHVSVRGEIIYNNKGAPLTSVGTVQDITERIEIEEKLMESLIEIAEVKNALDKTALVSSTNLMGIITSVNEKFCKKYMYSEMELIGSSHAILESGYHPKVFFKNLWDTIQKGNIWQGEIKNKTKNGSFCWVDTIIIPSLDKKGNPIQYIAIEQDITDRKHTELSLEKQRKNILRAQYEGEEREKNRISAELHDGLGQILTAAKLSLAALENKKGLDEAIKEKIKDIKFIVNEANIETGRISKHLLPRVLEDYGLIIAVEKILKDIKNTLNINTLFTVNPKVKIYSEKHRIIYRIIQESLNNAIKHSNATFLEVIFDIVNNYNVITILDNGKGFNKNIKKTGLGIENLKQRALSIDADLEILSEIGKGTTISLKMLA